MAHRKGGVRRLHPLPALMLRFPAFRPETPDAADVRSTLVESSTTAARWLALLALALVAAPAVARAATSTPCPGVRFLVTPALVPGGDLPTAAVVLDADGTLAIASGCARVPARVGRRGAGSTVRCGGRRAARSATRVCTRRSIGRRAASSPARSRPGA